jgi:NAD-dependent deacetylase
MSKTKIAVLSGAGISEESGIGTFRGAGGLWEGHKVEDVATPDGWNKNKELVLRFYNQRRALLQTVKPNRAHLEIKEWEENFDVTVITQNVDDLHERAGSSNIIHLHGELNKVRSTGDPSLIYEWEKDLSIEDFCEKGYPLRPHIVWFGESVPLFEEAEKIVSSADVLVVVGTSLKVYPAAGLIYSVKNNVPVFVVDPNNVAPNKANIHHVNKKATEGLAIITEELKKRYV